MPEITKAAAPKTDASAPADPIQIPPPPVNASPVMPVMSLDDYAVVRSTTDRRIELFNAFVSQASRSDMGTGTEAEFDAAYTAFMNAPV